MEWLAEYGLFLAKAATLVVAVGLAAALVAGAARQTARAGRQRRTPPEVVPLNREYRRMAAAFESVAMPRKAVRARRKADKAERKARDREERRRLASGGEGGRRRVFVIDFKGDLRASGVDALREEVTLVLAVATDRDEVVVRLENSGGAAHGHGLGASQLARIRERGIALTVTVDRVAASGGYMMACVANRILAAPFAIVGSIGAFAAIPNLHRLLEARGVDVEQFQAGEYKLTVTMLGKNTDAGREKFQDQLDNIHKLFREFRGRVPALPRRGAGGDRGVLARPGRARPQPRGRASNERRLPVRGEPRGGSLPDPGSRPAPPSAPARGAGRACGRSLHVPPFPLRPALQCRVTRPMSGRRDRPVAPTAAWMHAPPGLSGYASGQPDLWIPKRIYPTLDK